MKKTQFMGWAACGVAAALVGGILLVSGCEEAKGTRALTVDPSFVDLTGGVNAGVTNSVSGIQTFSVTEDSLLDLSLPLVWTVSNPNLGKISSSGGRSASYTRNNNHGDNAILVEDQYGAQGTATIRQ